MIDAVAIVCSVSAMLALILLGNDGDKYGETFYLLRRYGIWGGG